MNMTPIKYASLAPLLLLLSPSKRRHASADVTRGTIVLKRGADAGSIASALLPEDAFAQVGGIESCTSFDGIISFSHPMSLLPGDKFFSTGQLQLRAIEMMVDEINTKRCGVGVNGNRYGIQLSTYGDDSSKDKVEALVENAMIPFGAADNLLAASSASFWLGPYSSGLTGVMSPLANATNTVLVAGGAASTPVFRGYPTIFGTFPPTSQYLAQAIEALARAGARTVSSVWEDASFTRGVCAALDALAADHGLEIKSQTEVPSSPSGEDLDPVARNLSLSEMNPDVVVACVYDKGCTEWIASLRRAKWTPKGQVFTVCVGMDSFLEAVGASDAMYMTGISPWDPSLPMKDDVVGWSASEFADLFLSYTARTPTYHSASGAASVGALVQAIEQADSFDSNAVASVLSTEEFTTLYGRLSFNADGQSKAPSLFLQYDANTTVQTVYPLESRSGKLIYPMPTWEHRDCMFLSRCETGSGSTVPGTCQVDGSCKCLDPNTVSGGLGPNASCVIVPSEDFTYISTTFVVMGLVLFAFQAIFALSCGAWTIYYRSSHVVKASQPIFLCLICFGVLVMNLTMIPIGIQGTYRFIQNPETGEMTDEPNPDIARVDAACMAVPWLFSMGFSIVFSALFAKIWRVRRVLLAARQFRSKTVQAKDVASIMVWVVAVQMLILLCWQLLDPMRWQREIVFSDDNGYATKSVGSCRSKNMLRFLAPLLVIDGMMLLYALCLCFITRNVPSDLQEGTWITGTVLSIMQILVISIPILIITENNNNAFYFVRAAVVFLMSSTVTALVFLPKIYRHHFATMQDRRGAMSQFSGLSGRFTTIRSRGSNPLSSMQSSIHSTGRRRSMQESINDTSLMINTATIPSHCGINVQASSLKASLEDGGVGNGCLRSNGSDVTHDGERAKVVRFVSGLSETTTRSRHVNRNRPQNHEPVISNDPSLVSSHSSVSGRLEAEDDTNADLSEIRKSNDVNNSDDDEDDDINSSTASVLPPTNSVSSKPEDANTSTRVGVASDDIEMQRVTKMRYDFMSNRAVSVGEF